MAADQHARAVGVSYQCVERGQLVINPRAGKPDGKNKWCGDAAQRLVKIGTVLFFDPVQTVHRQFGRDCCRKRIKIADHGLGDQTVFMCKNGPAIRRDQSGRP